MPEKRNVMMVYIPARSTSFERTKTNREFSNNMLGYAGQFRGGKHEQYESGTRVPFTIRWPGHVKANHIDTKNVGPFIDWLPTLCAIAGVEFLPNQLDGEDASDIWKRPRTKPLVWKTSATGIAPAIRDGKKKSHLGRKRDSGIELYDLSIDASESNNVADKYPGVVASLRKKLRAWAAELPEKHKKTGHRKNRKRKNDD